MSVGRVLPGCVLAITCIRASGVDAQTPAPYRSQMSGEALYDAACVACHGSDGRGQPKSVIGFDTPLPDFTDCSFTTPEADVDWSAVVHLGGRARALDHRMPSFADALSDDEIMRVIAHVRRFCTEPRWPRGELNFPRAFFTEKAFPENEAVLTTTMSRRPAGAIEHEFLYEHRIGRRAQYEINVPVAMRRGQSGWHRGLGDVNAAFKYSFADSLARGAIFSAGGEVTLPTGKETEGLGGGTAIFEAFAMSAHALPHEGFVQVHAGFAAPAHADLAGRELYWRTAIGKTFFRHRWGRQWSPMAEVLLARPLGAEEGVEWDVVPQVQVSLSGLQHVLLNVGWRIPVNERDSRSQAAMVYLLWDWFDGGLFSNWRSR
jgi:mono/diheme cytochrome c family protein